MYEKDKNDFLKYISNPETRNYGFNLLIRHYQQKIYNTVRRVVINHDDANDVVQNVFIKAWSNIEQFRNESQLYTWLYRIAVNESINFINNKRFKYLIPIVNVEKKLAESLIDDNFFTGDEIQLKFQQALLTLPTKQRIVFNMRYYDETPYSEMSEILKTSEGALKASYHIALKKIEQFLKDN